MAAVRVALLGADLLGADRRARAVAVPRLVCLASFGLPATVAARAAGVPAVVSLAALLRFRRAGSLTGALGRAAVSTLPTFVAASP